MYIKPLLVTQKEQIFTFFILKFLHLKAVLVSKAQLISRLYANERKVKFQSTLMKWR